MTDYQDEFEHVGTPCWGSTHEHHGIRHRRTGIVYDFASHDGHKRNARYRETSLRGFANNGIAYQKNTGLRQLPAHETAACIRRYYGQDGYNAVTNNCEHFVNECLYGCKESFQVNSRVAWLLVAGVIIVGGYIVLKKGAEGGAGQ